MKFILSALALIFVSGSAFAFDFDQDDLDWGLFSNCSLVADCDDDEEPNTRVCAARDGRGQSFRYYTHVAHPISYTQRKAVEKCRAQSSSPASCRAAGCREY